MNHSERQNFHGDFEEALSFATKLHSEQVRKETDIPYISLLISVAGIVLENEGGCDEAIAALLHDSIEDQSDTFPGGAEALRKEIKDRFGGNVLGIVEGCTDAEVIPKPS
jgi:(p)ppGpp synthase/HD superfamily hydrolase